MMNKQASKVLWFVMRICWSGGNFSVSYD